MKIDINEIPRILLEYKIDQNTVQKVSDKIREIAEDNTPEKGVASPRSKYKHLILVSDPENKFAGIDNIPAWVLKIKEEEDHNKVLDRIKNGIKQFCLSRKGRKHPIKTIGEGIQVVGSRFFKPEKNPIVTKEPVIILVTDNKL